MVKSPVGRWMGQENTVKTVSRFNDVLFSFPLVTGDGTAERKTNSGLEALAEHPNVKKYDA